MSKIITYQAEKDAGIAEVIKANASIAYDQLQIADTDSVFMKHALTTFPSFNQAGKNDDDVYVYSI